MRKPTAETFVICPECGLRTRVSGQTPDPGNKCPQQQVAAKCPFVARAIAAIRKTLRQLDEVRTFTRACNVPRADSETAAHAFCTLAQPHRKTHRRPLVSHWSLPFAEPGLPARRQYCVGKRMLTSQDR